MGFASGEANLYTYAFSDPVAYVDPTGLSGVLVFPDPKKDKVGVYGSKIPETPGVYIVVAHSDGKGGFYDENERKMNAYEFAMEIKKRAGDKLERNDTVKLLSCKAGLSGAEDVAGHLQRNVLASKKKITIWSDGTYGPYKGGSFKLYKYKYGDIPLPPKKGDIVPSVLR
jgi:hypothetical protein